MSRKNNKTIKRRYNEHLKALEKVAEAKKEERKKTKEEKDVMDEAHELLELMNLAEDEQKMEVESNIRTIKKKKKIAKRKAKRPRMK